MDHPALQREDSFYKDDRPHPPPSPKPTRITLRERYYKKLEEFCYSDYCALTCAFICCCICLQTK